MSGVGNSQGPAGAVDWMGLSRSWGTLGMSKLSPDILPACRVYCVTSRRSEIYVNCLLFIDGYLVSVFIQAYMRGQVLTQDAGTYMRHL